jgi:hypothetical protein
MKPEIITLIFAGVVAISTAIYSFLTYRLVKETRLLREFHLEAHLIAYLVASETNPSITSLIIDNIGNGVARNLRFKIIRDVNYQNCGYLRDIGIFNKTIDFYPPNYERKYFLLNLSEDYENIIQDFIEFEIIYDDFLKKDKKQIFKLEFKDLKGVGRTIPPESYIGMISYRLEKIEKLVEKFIKN